MLLGMTQHGTDINSAPNDILECVHQKMVKRGHIPGGPHRLTDRLVITICWVESCGMTGHVVRAGNETFWRPGGPALHRDCIDFGD